MRKIAIQTGGWIAVAMTVCWRVQMVAGNPILDVIDWEVPPPPPVRSSAKLADEWLPLVLSAEGMQPPPDQPWHAAFRGSGSFRMPGTWDVSRWREHDFRSEEATAPVHVDPGPYLAALAWRDWIGIAGYGDVGNRAIYGLEDRMLLLPAPADRR